MSTAYNRMKRSHRSQKRHYMAGMNRYKDRALIGQGNNSSVPALLKKLFKGSRETKADIA